MDRFSILLYVVKLLFKVLVQGQMYPIPQNLAPNVNLSCCMDLWTLGSKLQKKNCWTFFQ